MRTPWLAALGAVLPNVFTPSWRPPVDDPALASPVEVRSEASRPPVSAGRAPAAGASRNGRPRDPEYLTVVPYIPSDGPPPCRRGRVHPRILNPFRAFPRRAADLRELMDAGGSSG